MQFSVGAGRCVIWSTDLDGVCVAENRNGSPTAARLGDASEPGCVGPIRFYRQICVDRLAHGGHGLPAEVMLGRRVHFDIHTLERGQDLAQCAIDNQHEYVFVEAAP